MKAARPGCLRVEDGGGGVKAIFHLSDDDGAPRDNQKTVTHELMSSDRQAALVLGVLEQEQEIC